MKYSIVIPVFNEEGNVSDLHAEVIETMNSIGEPFEVIFSNDGSSDGTLEALEQLSPVTIVNLRKNFGQTAALDAGIKEAQGEYIITMDGDGQNPPAEIPKMIAEMERGNYDVVSGWRADRKDPFMKRFVSRGANVLRSIFIKDNIHDSGCSLKMYKRECFDHVDLSGDMHRFIPAVLRWSGYTIGEVKIAHRPRKHGKTKYNSKRILVGFVDILNIWFWRKYSDRPLHLFGSVGIALAGIGGIIGVWMLIKRLILLQPIGNSYMPLMGVLLIVVGVQLFISGLLADIAIRHYNSGERHAYSIRNVIKR